MTDSHSVITLGIQLLFMNGGVVALVLVGTYSGVYSFDCITAVSV
jgi:hypothetical protein